MAIEKVSDENVGVDQLDSENIQIIETSSNKSSRNKTVMIYSTFTNRQKKILTIVLGMTSLASPLTANIYLPLLPLLQIQYQSSAQAINLTLTLYIVVQAIMPALFAPTADTHGRRPVSLITYMIYTFGSLGLVINDVTHRSYIGLLLLRAVEALGASACASIIYGVVSDVCIPAERGSMIGPTISASNIGTVLGPIIGGSIAWSSGNALWVFAALTIFGFVSTIMIALCLPETARSVVGNGNEGKRIRKLGIRQWLILGPQWSSTKSAVMGLKTEDEKNDTDVGLGNFVSNYDKSKKPFKIPNPLSSLSIMLWKDTSLIIFLASCSYAVWYTVLASIPQVYSKLYGWSEVLVGLAFLPSAITVIVAGFVNGPWTNFRFRRTAKEAGLPTDSHHVDGFPIELARARGLWPILFGTYIGVAGLGWAIQTHAPVTVLLVVQAIAGFLQVFLFFAFNTLLVDVNSDRPSTASAAASLVRSGLSGIGVAIVNPLVKIMGWGWYFTLMASVIGLLQGIGMILLRKYGQDWRQKRRRSETKEAERTSS